MLVPRVVSILSEEKNKQTLTPKRGTLTAFKMHRGRILRMDRGRTAL